MIGSRALARQELLSSAKKRANSKREIFQAQNANSKAKFSKLWRTRLKTANSKAKISKPRGTRGKKALIQPLIFPSPGEREAKKR